MRITSTDQLHCTQLCSLHTGIVVQPCSYAPTSERMPHYAPNFQPPNYANNYAGIIRRCPPLRASPSWYTWSANCLSRKVNQHCPSVLACRGKHSLTWMGCCSRHCGLTMRLNSIHVVTSDIEADESSCLFRLRPTGRSSGSQRSCCWCRSMKSDQAMHVTLGVVQDPDLLTQHAAVHWAVHWRRARTWRTCSNFALSATARDCRQLLSWERDCW